MKHYLTLSTYSGTSIGYTKEQLEMAITLVHRNTKGDLLEKPVDLILCIKTLRSQTGIGLLEAKMLIEHVRDMVDMIKGSRLISLIDPLCTDSSV